MSEENYNSEKKWSNLENLNEIRLGYGGGVLIKSYYFNGSGSGLGGGNSADASKNCWVMANSCTLTRNINVPSFLSYNMTFDSGNFFDGSSVEPDIRNDVILGSGLYNFSGNISFTLTYSALKVLFSDNFLSRNNVFDIYIYDGLKEVKMLCCYWNSFSITSNPRNVISCSLGFVSTNNQLETFSLSDEVTAEVQYKGFSEQMVEYWNTGVEGVDVESFALNFSKEATPVFLNTTSNCPSYIRTGKLSLSGTLNCWSDWDGEETKKIRIGDKVVSISGIIKTNSDGFSLNGINATGTKNYSFQIYNLTHSGQKSFNIE